MGSLSHPTRNPNLSVLRWVFSGKLLEPPGAFWGLLGSPAKLLGALSESPGIFLKSFLGPSGGCPEISFALHVASVAQMVSNPIHPGKEGAECFSMHHGVPCVVIVPMWREGGWECIFHSYCLSYLS
jgi:hypothetical protein